MLNNNLVFGFFSKIWKARDLMVLDPASSAVVFGPSIPKITLLRVVLSGRDGTVKIFQHLTSFRLGK